jgi:hypothetical protein
MVGNRKRVRHFFAFLWTFECVCVCVCVLFESVLYTGVSQESPDTICIYIYSLFGVDEQYNRVQYNIYILYNMVVVNITVRLHHVDSNI